MQTAPKTLAKLVVTMTLVLVATVSLHAQTSQQQNQQSQTEPAQTQQTQADQMLGPLNLSSDQIQRIRTINAELRDERQAANFRLRTAQRALAEAIQSPTPDEAVIAQRSKEVADAQANTIRLRSLTEARVLQVLTPDQRIKLRMMRQEAGMRRRGNQQLRMLDRRPNALQQNQNPNALNQRQQRRLMRQQQQQKRP